ncbi:carbamate kinase [Enterococcus sp. PF1-24]|uniref:carbamate kinase n=1 Tax=unclassified Enterococcus TaxID=2608891 RepID=UPI002474E704|nr:MULTISPECIES: carbamate kinase [unclassified Enterococcus]MDH6365354.1 carbamate kinase [Enterococcus sp. PFB1-1]MDH6402455.1 carbamate kinase [Enterococcus sp. PF1-24]
MPKQKIVIALGGNAILSKDASAKAQQQALETTAKYLTGFIKQGHQLIISHGNGPQVGNLLLQQAATDNEKNPAMPLDTCVAMTEGSIGYWLQNALQNQLKQEKLEKDVLSAVTQVIVDEMDPAFKKPTKPVGPFLTKEEAEQAAKDSGATFVEDAGRGWRKVVASPKPIAIKEANGIKKMIEEDIVVICTGGGGIPVIETAEGLVGTEAVIDKDFASEKLAELVSADLFIILTGVKYVYIDFNTPQQKKLTKVSVAELEGYIAENQFAPGSMLPKIQAAIEFVEKVPHGKAVITSLENISALLDGESGTVIYK